jgi:hypothetical protein
MAKVAMVIVYLNKIRTAFYFVQATPEQLVALRKPGIRQGYSMQ